MTNVTCNACQHRGHVSKNCLNQRQGSSGQGRMQSAASNTRDSGIRCYVCKELGHRARDCPKKHQRDISSSVGNAPPAQRLTQQQSQRRELREA